MRTRKNSRQDEYVSRAKARVRARVYTPRCGCGRRLSAVDLLVGECSQCQAARRRPRTA